MREILSESEAGVSSKIGRLEELNGHEKLTGKLWKANGTQWQCRFKPEHITSLPDAWMHTVKLTDRTHPSRRR